MLRQMNKYLVYRHIRLDKNEPFYIGIGNEKRPYEKRRRNKYWKNIINKTEYKIEILFNDLTWGQACEKEKELIQLYGRKDLSLGTLVNLTDGGDGTLNTISWNKGKSGLFKHSDETKKHLSELRKNKPLTEKQIESLKNRKKTQYWLGKKLSDEHRNKLSIKATGRKAANKDVLKYSEELIRQIQNDYIPFKFGTIKLSQKYNIPTSTIERYLKINLRNG